MNFGINQIKDLLILSVNGKDWKKKLRKRKKNKLVNEVNFE